MGGYRTYFNGEFQLDEAPTAEQVAELTEFLDAEHRDPKTHTNPKGIPSIWCDWSINSEGTIIYCDDAFYGSEYTEWLELIIEKFLKPWGRVLEGEATWDGDESDDSGTITIENNVVTAKSITDELNEYSTRADQLEEGLRKILETIPNQIPLFMGINSTVDEIIKEYLAKSDIPVTLPMKDLVKLAKGE